MADALGPARERSLLDIGGGTGNFAAALREAGFRVALCDLSLAMVRRAAEKLSDAAWVAVGDAQRLPFADAAFDCAVAINILTHLPNWRELPHEARRVIREGPFVVKASTRQTIEANWVCEYLPAVPEQEHYHSENEIREALLEAGFRRVELRHVHYRDLVDGSFQAFKHFPEVFLDDALIGNTGFMQRLPRDELSRAVEAIRRDYHSGKLQEVIARYEGLVREYGDGSIFVAYP